MEKPYLNEKEAAEYSGFSVHTLRKWRKKDKGFTWKKLENGSIRYVKIDIDNWINPPEKILTSDQFPV